MQSRTSAHKTSIYLLLGLTVVAVMCLHGRYALAQAQVSCPLPPDASPPPAPAVRAALQTLVRQPDARFDAAVPGPGGQSGIPGASGHAAVYTSANLGIPIIVVAGFDVDESHLATEAIDSGDPEITAADVVDRETLRAFVNQAGAFYIASAQQQNGDHLRTKNAMRDPNGPWIHGNVYVHIVDRISNVILFHGAFPNRLELQPPGITRDNVTGELVFDQLVAAATSSPEGGFWEYHFDDPTDERDDAGVPKVGFARVFTGEFQRADGADFPIDIIVASGFYPPAPEGVVEGPNATIKALLPQVMRAMTASTVDAISARIRQATSGSAPENRLSLGGALRYADVASGLTVEGRARILFAHSSDYEEWGVSGLLRYDQGAAGRGLTASVQPAWGRTASGVRRMWASGAAGELLPVDAMAPRVNAEVGYGIDMAPGLGVVAPFAGAAFSAEDAQLWRMGARWQVSPEARLNLEGARRNDAYHDEPEHSLTLTAAMLW